MALAMSLSRATGRPATGLISSRRRNTARRTAAAQARSDDRPNAALLTLSAGVLLAQSAMVDPAAAAQLSAAPDQGVLTASQITASNSNKFPSAIAPSVPFDASNITRTSTGEDAETDANLDQIKQVQLPYKLDSIEPAIDNKTMNFHYGTHYATYVNNTNAALNNATGISNKSNLTALITSIKSLPSPLNTTIRNQAGGAWNHALYFKQLAPPGSPGTELTSISPALKGAIDGSFGSVDAAKEELTTAATKVFGSGWAWLCYTGEDKPLTVTSTPNQDNPLMGDLPGATAVKASGCTPILGIDVWEHAYYLKHGPKRAAYITDFWTVVNWQQVSKNFDLAKAGKAEAIVSNPSSTGAKTASAMTATTSTQG